jgi:tartrate dehydratase beta subunit/fumarate hydratase class I family protein
VELLEYPELGMGAIWKIEAEDFPAVILVDDTGRLLPTNLHLIKKLAARMLCASRL